MHTRYTVHIPCAHIIHINIQHASGISHLLLPCIRSSSTVTQQITLPWCECCDAILYAYTRMTIWTMIWTYTPTHTTHTTTLNMTSHIKNRNRQHTWCTWYKHRTCTIPTTLTISSCHLIRHALRVSYHHHDGNRVFTEDIPRQHTPYIYIHTYKHTYIHTHTHSTT